jgi:abhydrolase domain-containing protein 13
MSFRLPFLKELTRALNCSAFALSYRGYGISKGSPSEKGLRIDAMAALQWVQQRGDTGPVIVMGRSLGGAVALRAAADCILASKITATSAGTTTKNNIELKGLIIENTFSTMAATVGHIMPFLSPFIGPGKFGNFLLRNKWDNVESAKELTNFPILWLSSLQDEMLPPVHMSELYSLHPKEPWKFVTFENGRHIDTYESHAAQYWPILKDFVDAKLNIHTVGGPSSQRQAPQDGKEQGEDVDEGWVAVSDESKKEL